MQRIPLRRRLRAGFTLMEVVVVVSILAILSAIATPMIGGVIQKGKVAAARADCDAISEAIGRYYTDNGKYPPGTQNNPKYNYAKWPDHQKGVEVLSPWLLEGTVKYLGDKFDKDPWGNRYSYHIYTLNNPYMDVVVYSNGPDGVNSSWNGTYWNKGEFAGDDIGSFYDAE